MTDRMPTLVLAKTDIPDPRVELAKLGPLLPYRVHVQAHAERPAGRYELRLVNNQFEVARTPDADPESLFESETDQADARQARDLDADAALRLPLAWTITGTFALDKAVRASPGVSVAAALTTAVVAEYVLATDLATVGRLAPSRTRRVLVAMEPAPAVHVGQLTVIGLSDPGTVGKVALPDPELLPGEADDADAPPPAGVLLGADGPDLQTGPATGPWAGAVAHTRKIAAQLAWQALASDPAAAPVLEFYGYKRVTLTLPTLDAWTEQQTEDALRLRRWAFAESSPDRLLAIRQVVSLYDGDEALENARDVQASAEVVYTGLRTDAVAEAVKSNREAYAQAQDTVRQAVKNAQDLIKSAAERLLATLASIGAVVIARANTTLSDHTSRGLMLLIAGFLILLAVASAVFEGSLLAQPIRCLGDDLAHQASLLSDAQREKVTQTPSLLATRKRLNALRWAVPGLYLVFAVAIIAVGYPSRYV